MEGQVPGRREPDRPPAHGVRDASHLRISDEDRYKVAEVLRLPLLGFRVAADDFFAQIEQALVDAGWRSRWSA